MEKIMVTQFPDASPGNPQGAAVGVPQTMISLRDLHDFVKKNAWSPLVFKTNYRKKDLFDETSLLVIDIDEGLTLNETRKRLQKLSLSYSLTLSKSHQKTKKSGSVTIKPPCDRFRLVVPVENKIVDGGTYLTTLVNFIKNFPEADEKCFDLARYYFPSSGEGKAFIQTKGKPFPVYSSNLSYDEVSDNLKKTNKADSFKKVKVRDFIEQAHTGMPGNFNQGLYSTSYWSAMNGKTHEEIIKDISELGLPSPLDSSDLRTIASAVAGASRTPKDNFKKSSDQAYLEATSDFLKSAWNDRLHVITDEFGGRLILKTQSKNTVKNVGIKLLVAEATKLFSGTPYLRKPTRIQEAIENYLNLIEPLDEMPKSILKSDDVDLAFNRLNFDLKKIETPLFDELIGRCTNPRALCAFIFSIFVPRADRQQYVWLYGQGGNGKGALARFLRRCLGSAYHAERAWGAAMNKHFTAGFVGKRLAVFSDSNATKFVTSEMFKELSGGDPIKVEKKYENPVTVNLDTKFMFLSNTIPCISSQKSDLRRIIFSEIAPINVDADSEYENSLWQEREGILWKCEKIYHSLSKNNGPIKIDITSSMELAEDSEVHFKVIFEEIFIQDDFSEMTSEEFYKLASGPCKEHNIGFQDFKQWTMRVYNLASARDTASKNKRIIRGIGNRISYEEPSNHPLKIIKMKR